VWSRAGAAGAAGAALLAACSTGGHAASPVGAAGLAPGGEAVAVSRACPPPTPDTAGGTVKEASNVTYATRDGQPLRLDVAWPGTGGPHPLVILLHGGGWSGGSRASLVDEMRSLARMGYAAAVVEYRLTQAPRNVFPAAVADVRCALRFLRSRAGDYAIAPERVAAAGFSAGAHLASMLGAAADVARLDEACPAGEQDAGVQAVISYAGPQDLRVQGPYTQEQARLVTNFLGVFPGDDPDRAALASPIVHVSGGDPPFLLVHGTRDDLVPVAHSRRMAAALREVGTPATVLELPRTGHSFAGFTSNERADVRCTVTDFLARWLGR
jgi:acetyl esterase/lipase